jgi:hypothetical protein
MSAESLSGCGAPMVAPLSSLRNARGLAPQ